MEHSADPVTTFTATESREGFISGEVSAVELTTMALTSAATQSALGAFLHLDAEYALHRAQEIDQIRAAVLDSRSGEARDAAMAQLSSRSPLLGMPTAFKDLVHVAGMPTTMGTSALAPTVPGRDDPLARRVHTAGAISIGKTQVPEFGLPCYSENDIAPPARNPLAPSRTAGGSTGGGAGAVAAGILPMVPGNDGGGSVRIPAAACGLIGLKPGRGRLPDDQQRQSVDNLATSGPIAATVQDAALLFDVMAGHHFTPKPGSSGLPLGEAMFGVERATQEGLAPLRIGVTTESPFSPELEIVLAEPAVEALERGLNTLGRLGHIIQGSSHCTGVDAFWPEHYHQNFQALWTSRLGGLEFSAEAQPRLTALTRYFIELSADRPADQTEAAIRALEEFSANAEAFMGPWDVLATPMLAFAPPEVGWFSKMDPAENYREQCRFTPYSSVINVMGLPAINVPTHTDAEGLSWSIQLIGRHGAEEQLLALAATMLQH